MRRATTAFFAILAAVAAIASAATAADYAPPTPDPATLTPEVIALVGATPVTTTQYERKLRVYKLASPNSLNSKHRRAVVRRRIVSGLVTAQWYSQEAQQLGVVLTDKDVEDRFEPLKQQSFPTRQPPSVVTLQVMTVFSPMTEL